MEPDYSRDALLRFLRYVGDKGLVTQQQAQNWRVATGKIIDDISPTEAEDVRRIDVELAFRRFANRHGNRYTPKTLAEYRKRATAAIGSFVQWASNPESFRPRGRERTKKSEGNNRTGPEAAPERSALAPEFGVEPPRSVPQPVGDALEMPYPLRPDFLVRMRIPRDLSADEARRLGAFLLTLTSDFRPTE